METFIAGDIVVVLFPFSDLSNSKQRPALVLGSNRNDKDVVICQITTQLNKDAYAIELLNKDVEGDLKKASNIRPNKIFTVEKKIIRYKIGRVSNEKFNEVTGKLFDYVSSSKGK